MKRKLIIVLDCGATNVRAVAVDEDMNIPAQKSFPNTTHPDPFYHGGLIWDADEIWDKLRSAIRAIINCFQLSVLRFPIEGVRSIRQTLSVR